VWELRVEVSLLDGVEDVQFAEGRAACWARVSCGLGAIQPGLDAMSVEQVVAGGEADAGVVLSGCEAAFVLVWVELLLADETILTLHGFGGDVAVDVVGDVIRHSWEGGLNVIDDGGDRIHCRDWGVLFLFRRKGRET
jgi:hypothetical protein